MNAESKICSRNEIRRLEKAARDKDKNKLIEWGRQFENQIRDEYDKRYNEEYDRAFKEDFANVVDTFCLAITYTLHFNEKTKFGRERTINFLNDLLVTVDLFRTGEYSPEDYRKELEKDGIYFSDVQKITKKKLRNEGHFKNKEMD